MSVKIHSVSTYLPSNIVSNVDLASKLDTTHDWIFSRTGISNRRLSSDDEDVPYMAYKVAENLIHSSKVSLDQVGVIIVATSSATPKIPSIASKIQHQLGLIGCNSFDLNAACSGFVCAVNVAEKLLQSSDKPYALVVGSEQMSKMVDWTDRSTAILFGDGAGGVLLQKDDQAFFSSSFTSANHYDLLNTDATHGQNWIQMDGRNVFRLAIKHCCEVIDELSSTLPQSFFDLVVPHQANKRIITSIQQKYMTHSCQWVSCIKNYANTSAASIPIALHDYAMNDSCLPSQLTLLIGFGAGFKVDACAIQLSKDFVGV